MSEKDKLNKENPGAENSAPGTPSAQGNQDQVKVIAEKDHFKVLNVKHTNFVLQDGQKVDLRFGPPSNALKLYKSGKFKYIGLKKGAEVLFADLSKEEIEKLIAQAPVESDVAILKKAINK